MNNVIKLPAARMAGSASSFPIRPLVRSALTAGMFAGAAAAAGTVLVTELFGVSLGTATRE